MSLSKRFRASKLSGENDALFGALMQAAVDGVLVVDASGIIQAFNAACEELFGYGAEEAIGQSGKMLLAESHRHDFGPCSGPGRETLGRRKDGTTFPVYLSRGEGEIDGERMFVVIVHGLAGRKQAETRAHEHEVQADGKTIYTGVLRDISGRQGAERRAEALQAELLHVSRLNAMGQMSAAIAHELNQPLTAMMNYMRAARRTLESAQENAVPRALEMVDKAANQVLRAGAIIRNLREFVEKRDSKRTPENLNKVLEEAVALGFVGAAHLDVNIRFDLDPAIPQVHIDRIQIQQVLINLIRNAIDAMQDAPARALIFQTRRGADGTVELTVSDTGPGLPPDVRARLFQPFVTTKDRGMGIGLTICKSIVDSHGGSIVAVDGPTGGAAFRIRLPAFSGERGDA